ncbi:SDR family oxidoreductase [Paraburkholderia fungorum]|jgi:short-subunit dehydrogenase|uniref:Short-subunit dehydrogenase n=1 Tax=Paraburkholderia fungorum TaxID=134537 RepID=A0AAW3US40_9BURK|nr:SDR family oxidoreductase [Paraburkholderia fungorum]MBB4512306.1 short-subunit dehydrogenase [Paraburkholderia fungorum]MBB6200212.1 short-subunit dehydrogenase [Paraburkholderia fungorum]
MWGVFNQPKVVVITGASAGVGRAAALAFAQRGAQVALLARDQASLEDTAGQVRELGVQALPIALDVSDADAVERAAARVEAELGPIDVWVNNAMLTVFGPVASLTPDEFSRVTHVTYLGYVWGTMAALRRMAPRNRGCIVQVGSALAYRSIPLQAAYCGAKHAIRGFTDALRCELLHEHSRIHLTMVQMPALNTPQFDWAENHMPHAPQPVAPIYQPEVAARAIVWAATHRRREVYVGVSTIKAIVANKIAPGLLDRYLGRTGYQSQERAAPANAAAPSNLWQPVAGAHRVHGPFDAHANEHSVALWLNTHRPLALGAALAIAVLGWQQCRRRPHR